MTLLELHVDVARVANALEKIAGLLEDLVTIKNSPPRDIKVEQATVDDLHYPTEGEIADFRAQVDKFAEYTKTVPYSEAFRDALDWWMANEKEIHGDQWQAPKWADVFAAASGGSAPADSRK